jgi:hypothetical protein
MALAVWPDQQWPLLLSLPAMQATLQQLIQAAAAATCCPCCCS